MRQYKPVSGEIETTTIPPPIDVFKLVAIIRLHPPLLCLLTATPEIAWLREYTSAWQVEQFYCKYAGLTKIIFVHIYKKLDWDPRI